MSPKASRSPLGRLICKLKFSFLLSILGSWLLLLPRLDLYGFDHELFQGPNVFFYLDVAGLALVFLGLFMAFFYGRRLKPRIRRIDELGETQW